MKTLTDTDTMAITAIDDDLDRPSAVWLRRSTFAEQVVRLVSETRDSAELKSALAVLRADARQRRSANARGRITSVRDARPMPFAAAEETAISDAPQARCGQARP